MKKESYVDWSKEDLIKEIKKLKKRKKYGVVWDEEHTKEKFEKEAQGKLPVLKEVINKEIKTDENKPINILIEGDNYHALSVLNYTHKGAIDIIYIDPPYNTGSGDSFRYNDKIVDKEDAYRHSKWLSFMSKRLKLAKNLLKNTGTIFIAIDDNEVAQLKLLCDEIFGESNFIATICWKSRDSISNDLIMSQNHNYHLVYAKKFKEIFDRRNSFRLPKELKGFKNPDNDSRGPWKLMPVDGPGGAAKGNPHYGFLGIRGYWRYSKQTMQKLYESGQIVKSSTGKSIQRKYYLRDAKKSGTAATTWWDDAGTTTQGTKELIEIFREKIFNNPKPTTLIDKILVLATDNTMEYIILDFFAGSGTTAHSVLKLNKEDGGNRKFILCTNNENNICTDVCYPRIKKVIRGYTNTKGKKVGGIFENLKYFKTAFVDSEPTDINKKRLVDQSTEMLCLKENCFDQVKSGKHFRIFKHNDSKYLGIVYDDDGIEPFKREVKKLNKKISVYVFSLDESAREEEFEDVVDLVDLKPIPEVILNVYRRIFK